ncbi:MAG TPA: class I SAM-dependent methyltransferase [Ktedonobacteraceae bacterium]|nr:class I SAM-dependent methyltransferase [Ktedonobacteraceae bacterium]
MTLQPSGTADLAAIKARQRHGWAAGDYSVPGACLVVVSENLCEAVELRANQKVLDVATGSGNTAIAAARRFCEVTGIDYTPSLLERAQERASAERLPVTFLEADAENLPFPAASFDVVLSTLGVMFTPNQEQAANELLRVCRPGGKIGLASWSPGGLFGQMGRVMATYVPPPAGLRPPALWGTEERIQELFGTEITSLQATQRIFFHRYRSAQHAVEISCTYYGPVAMAIQALEPATRQCLYRDLQVVFEQANQSSDDTLVAPGEYLEVVAVRR